LKAEGLVEAVLAIVEETGIDPRWLELELIRSGPGQAQQTEGGQAGPAVQRLTAANHTPQALTLNPISAPARDASA
jgi:hypothetical protein